MFSQIKKNTQRIERALEAVEKMTKQEISQLQMEQNLLELRKKRITSLKNSLGIFGSTYQFQSSKRDTLEQQKPYKQNAVDPWSIFKRTPVVEYKIPERNFQKQFENKISKYREQCFQKFRKSEDQPLSANNSDLAQAPRQANPIIENKQSTDFNQINENKFKEQGAPVSVSLLAKEQKKSPTQPIGFIPGIFQGKGTSLFQRKFEAPQVQQPKSLIIGNKLFSQGNPLAEVKQSKDLIFNQNLRKKDETKTPPLIFPSANNKISEAQSEKKSLFAAQSSQKSLFPNIKNQPIKINFFNNIMSKQQNINKVTDMNKGEFKFGQTPKKTDANQPIPFLLSNQQKVDKNKVDQPVFKMNAADNTFSFPKKEANFTPANAASLDLGKKNNELESGLATDLFKKNNQDQKQKTIFGGNLGFNVSDKQKVPAQMSFDNIFSQNKAQTNNLLPQPQNTSNVLSLNSNISLGAKRDQSYESGSLFSGISNPLLPSSSANTEKSSQLTIEQGSKNSLFNQKSGITLFPISGSNNSKSTQVDLGVKSKEQTQVKQPSQIIGNFVKSKQGGLFSNMTKESEKKVSSNALFTPAQPLTGNSLFQQPAGTSLFANPSGSLFGNSNKGTLFSNQGRPEGGKLFEEQSQEDAGGEGDDQGVIEDKSEIDPTKSTGNYHYEQSKTLFKEAIPKIKKGSNNIIENVTVSIERFNNSSNSLMCVRLANKCPYFTGFIVPNVTEISQLGDSGSEYRNLCIKKIMINEGGKASLEVLKLQFKDNNNGSSFFEIFKKQLEKKN